MSKFVDKYTKNMDVESIQEALNIAKELKEATEKDDQQKLKELQSSKTLLLMLLEYLIRSSSNPTIDPAIIEVICNFLGIKVSKDKKKEVEEEKEEEQPEKERKEHLYRVACYELYKVVNPNKLAGETELSNFLNNVNRVGIREALKYIDPEFARQMTKQTRIADDPKAAVKGNFVDQIEKTGKGPARGL